MTEKCLSHSYNYNRDSSYLDEAFSLLYKQFVGECSSVESEQNEPEHHSAVAWNVGEVKNYDSIIFEPVVLARGRDDPIQATCASPTSFGRQVLKPHESSLPTSFFTTGENFKLDNIDRMLENEKEQDEDTCNLRDRNAIFDHTNFGNSPIVPKKNVMVSKSHYVKKVITSGAKFPRFAEETCSFQNRNRNILEDATVRNNLVVPAISKIPYAKNRSFVPVMSKISYDNNAVTFPSYHASNGTPCKKVQYNGNPLMTTSPLFENDLCPSSKKLTMMKINPSKAKFPSKYASKNTLARNPACNSSIKASECLNVTQTSGMLGSADPNHKKRKKRQINQAGSQKNGFPNKVRAIMKMRMIERHGLKTRIVMEPCLVYD